jgi:hypothetical protein
MPFIGENEEGVVEEDLLAFCPPNIVADPVLVGVALVPLEASAPEQIFHAGPQRQYTTGIYGPSRGRGDA